MLLSACPFDEDIYTDMLEIPGSRNLLVLSRARKHTAHARPDMEQVQDIKYTELSEDTRSNKLKQ